MATKKILTDIVITDGSITSDSANVGTATGGVAGSQFTSKSDSTSTGTNVNTWIDINRVNTSTATGGTYGMVNRVVSNTSSLDGGIVGANLIGRQSGSGGAEYIFGEIVQADQLGGGDADMVIASSIRSNTKNNSTGTVNYNRGISVNAAHDSASGTVNYLQSAHLTAGLVNGTAGEVIVTVIDFDRSGGTITNDFAYLQIQEDAGSHTVGGTARSINSLNTLPSEFAGSIESTSFIKTGGTSSQFLKADGSVDTSTYVPTSTLASYIRSNVNDIFTGRLTGSQLWLGGGVITGQGSSAAKLQVNGLQRTGDIYLHELSSGVPTSSSLQLRNNSGDLEWDGDTVYHTGNLTISGSNTGDQDLSSFLTASSTQSKYLRSDADDVTNSNLGLNQDKKITFDSDSEGFAYIRAISETDGNRPAGALVYASAQEHHFIDGEDDSYNGLFASSFNIDGGTASQFLKANGTVDSNTYLTSSSTQSKYLRSDGDDTLDGSLTVDGGTGVATSGGTLIVKQKGDTISDGIAITSSNASSHRIWKDASGNLNIGGSSAGSSFVQDLSGNLSISGSVKATSLEVDNGAADGGSLVLNSLGNNNWQLDNHSGALRMFTGGSVKQTIAQNGYASFTSTVQSTKFYVGTLPSDNQWAFQARNASSTADSGLYFGSGSAELFLRNSSNTLTGRIRANGNSYLTGGNLGVGTDAPSSGISSTRILKVSSSGNSEVNVDHTDGGTSSDIGLFSFSRNGDHLAHMKASHDGSTTAAFLSFHTQPSGGSYTSPQSNEQMRITSIGRVGIKATNPQSELHVSSGDTTETTLIVGASGTINDVSSRIFLNEGEFGVTDSKDYGFSLAYDGQGSNYGLPANTFGIIRHNNSSAGAHVLTIQRANGNVGIGTDAALEKLEVQGTVYATPIVYAANQDAYALKMGASNSTSFDMGIKAKSTSSGGPYMSLCSSNTEDVIVVQNSNVGINKVSPAYNLDVTGNGRFTSTVVATNFILSSDKRLKNNVEEVNSNHIDVNWKTFEMNSEEGQSRYGVIAQELEEVHPEFVRTDKKGMKSVAYIDLLIAKIAELEARLDKANI